MIKKIKLLPAYLLQLVFISIIVTLFASCGENPGENPDSFDSYIEFTNYGSKLEFDDQQVWVRNTSTNIPSKMYEKYDGNNSLYIINEYVQLIGLGNITEGKLNFSIDSPGDLLEWDNLKLFFEIITEGEGWDVEADNDVNGTFIEIANFSEDIHTPMQMNYVLMREGISGTNNSFSSEWVFFVYVDRNCKITGKYKEDTRVTYIFNAFELNLTEGWNTICFKQTYTSVGRSTFEMSVKNPNIKWVLIPNIPTK